MRKPFHSRKEAEQALKKTEQHLKGDSARESTIGKDGGRGVEVEASETYVS